MPDLVVRRAEPDDDAEVLALLVSIMGRNPVAPNRDFYRWKHELNPFGRSPAWVAVVDGRVVGFRTFMRWKFEAHDGMLNAVRAVDTVTHPEHRGRGLFRTLTTAAVDELTAEGVDLVFNTPNDASRPGYLKMGWQPVGRLPVTLVPGGPTHWRRLAGARAAAEIWSRPTQVGLPVHDVDVSQWLVRPSRPAAGLRTPRTPEFVRWRYGFQPLHYRVHRVADGRAAVVFRLRHRGRATELAVLDVLGDDRELRLRHVRALVSATGADYALSLASPGGVRGLRLERLGPLLTARRLSTDPPATPGGWDLSLGDVELF